MFGSLSSCAQKQNFEGTKSSEIKRKKPLSVKAGSEIHESFRQNALKVFEFALEVLMLGAFILLKNTK